MQKIYLEATTEALRSNLNEATLNDRVKNS